MSGRVKKLLHLRISTIILLFWGDYPPSNEKKFLGSLTLAITIPPTLASMSRRPFFNRILQLKLESPELQRRFAHVYL